MAIMRWRPWSEVAGVQDEVNKIFDEFFNRPAGSNAMFTAPLDIAETENEFIVHLEVAGVAQSDIDISVHDGVLTVKGEKKFAEAKKKEAQWHRIERSYGAFSRSLTLPNTVNQESIKATYTDGVLTVSMAKKEETKPRSIRIN